MGNKDIDGMTFEELKAEYEKAMEAMRYWNRKATEISERFRLYREGVTNLTKITEAGL